MGHGSVGEEVMLDGHGEGHGGEYEAGRLAANLLCGSAATFLITSALLNATAKDETDPSGPEPRWPLSLRVGVRTTAALGTAALVLIPCELWMVSQPQP